MSLRKYVLIWCSEFILQLDMIVTIVYQGMKHCTKLNQVIGRRM